MAGGRGTRLGLGTKSLIIYKNKIILEYVIESCVRAGIKRIIVALAPKRFEKGVEKAKLERLYSLIRKYPSIKFVRGPDSNTRRGPNNYRKYLNEKLPFYFLCGQSPQSSLFLKRLATLYKKNTIVVSGYRQCYGCEVSIGLSNKEKIKAFTNVKSAAPKNFKVSGKNYITEFPYVLNFSFYDKFVKRDNFKNIIEMYPSRFLENGGFVYFSVNPVKVPEIDYINDLQKLFRSIDILVKKNYRT